MSELAPIALFVYNRLDETIKTVEALQKNSLADESLLYIFSDAAKNSKSTEAVLQVRKYLQSINGFKKIYIIEREKNWGLANSVISGVSEIILKYKKIIVLEDDLITSKNFITFMNQSLIFYEDKNIFSISGYSLPLEFSEAYKHDIYFGYRASSWGWGTWAKEWKDIDWEVQNYKEFIRSPQSKKRFNRGGEDMVRMLKKQMEGKIDSWAIRWCYSQSQQNKLTVFPKLSKVKNIGFGENATHTKSKILLKELVDETSNEHFVFSSEVYIDEQIAKNFRYYFSNLYKMKTKLLDILR